MLSVFYSFKRVLTRVILLLALVSFFNLISSFVLFAQPSYADALNIDTKEALSEIREDLAKKDPDELYEKAIETSSDVKMGEEKKYEQNLQEYYQENPEKGGILKGAKDLLNIKEEK